jgi:predicted RNA-binding protein
MMNPDTCHWILVASHARVEADSERDLHRFEDENRARLLQAGDYLVFYSPVEEYQRHEPCRKFTAVARVVDQKPETIVTDEGSVWFERKLQFQPGKAVEILPLLDRLSFIRDRRHWGYPFKAHLFEIPERDFQVIASAMGIEGI